MPEKLSLRQRLAGPGGAPSRAVQLAVSAFACLAFLGGFLVHSGRGAEPHRGAVVQVEQLAGDMPVAPAPAALKLSRVASLPALQRPQRSRRARKAAPRAKLVVAAPTPAPTPEPVATPTPPPAAAPAPPPAPAAPARPAPAPRPAPPAPAPRAAPPAGQTFDSSG